MVKKALASVPAGTPTDDWTAFAKATKLKAGVLKKIRPFITEKDPTAQPIDGEPDSELRETEQIPMSYGGGIEEYLKNEVHPYAEDAWFDMKSIRIGYQLSFIKYFSHAPQMRTMDEIIAALKVIEQESEGELAEIVGGLKI